MDEILAALAEQQAELDTLLTERSQAEWDRPSRCDGWTVADVVLHVAQTNDMATASAEGRYAGYLAEAAAGLPPVADVDEGAEAMVARERGAPGEAVHARWQESARVLRAALTACDPHQRVQWVAGQLSARTLATTRLAETWIHTGDVAPALGVSLEPGDRLRHIARLAWRTLPYAFGRSGRELTGPVAFDLKGPSGALWQFGLDDGPVTVIRGDGVELCLVAARRLAPADTNLVTEGPDADAVLELVRTYA